MKRVVLITGSSSGIGKATAELFQSRGWIVVATMRSPSQSHPLAALENVELLPLDVTNDTQIKKAIATTIQRHGRLDALINNAGYGLFGPLEGVSESQIADQLYTNVLGVMNTTRHTMPHLRKSKGAVVSISSVLGRTTLPYFSLYSSSKWAVEGFMDGLAFEAEDTGVRVRLIEPGSVKTGFFPAKQQPVSEIPSAYKKPFAGMRDALGRFEQNGIAPEVIAATIYQATTSRSRRLRYPVRMTTRVMIWLHSVLPSGLYRRGVRRVMR